MQSLEDSTDILNDLVNKIQEEEDKKAVIEGRLEHKDKKTIRLDDIDEITRSLRE